MELESRKQELEKELSEITNYINQLRNALAQKEKEYLITTGKLMEINELLKEPEEES